VVSLTEVRVARGSHADLAQRPSKGVVLTMDEVGVPAMPPVQHVVPVNPQLYVEEE
jgi:hypothetical protein